MDDKLVKEKIQKNVDLGDKMEKGDVDACIELSVQHGLMTKEDRAFIKKYQAMDKKA